MPALGADGRAQKTFAKEFEVVSPGGVRRFAGGRAPGEVCLPLGVDVNEFQPENEVGLVTHTFAESKDRTQSVAVLRQCVQ